MRTWRSAPVRMFCRWSISVGPIISSDLPDSRPTRMTKSELITRLAERYPQLIAKDADFAVNTILEAMADSLSVGQRIEIRGFGSFALSTRPPRVGRNPKSGERVLVPAKRVPHFKAGKELRERVDIGASAEGKADPARARADDEAAVHHKAS